MVDNTETDNDDSPETIELPSRVFAWHDDSLNTIPEYLQSEGIIGENEVVQRCKLDITAEESVKVTHLETEIDPAMEAADD